MNVGDIVKVKDEAGNRVKARVIKMEQDTESIDVTMDGSYGTRASTFREHVPGQTRTTVTLELVGQGKSPKACKLKLGDKGSCSYRFVDEMCDAQATAQYDPYMEELYDEKMIVMYCEDHLQERRDEV